jgi:ABC-2 type transport system ATP-binding protein
MDITISEISKQFEKNQVLSDITFTISSGDIICLLGPSGSGKTTLIRLLVASDPRHRLTHKKPWVEIFSTQGS